MAMQCACGPRLGFVRFVELSVLCTSERDLQERGRHVGWRGAAELTSPPPCGRRGRGAARQSPSALARSPAPAITNHQSHSTFKPATCTENTPQMRHQLVFRALSGARIYVACAPQNRICVFLLWFPGEEPCVMCWHGAWSGVGGESSRSRKRLATTARASCSDMGLTPGNDLLT